MTDVTERFHPEAQAELDAAIAYYEERRSGLGLDLQAEVQAAVDLIQRNPQLCPLHKDTAYRKRVLNRFPYTVFYLDREDSTWIMAVAHQKRKPGYWASRTIE
jgi:toxin ParE1/3/4